MKIFYPLKRQLLRFAVVLAMALVASGSYAATMHLVGGLITYSNGEYPASITFTAYIQSRPAQVLTISNSPESGYMDGYYWIQLSPLATNWTEGDVLHVEISDGLGATASGDVSLTFSDFDALDLEFSSAGINTAPVVSDIPSQTIAEGSSFNSINLDAYVTDNETPDANIVWSYSGNTDLAVSIVNRVATISLPDVNWNGSETITFTATDDDVTNPLSDSDDAVFTVTAVNDAPVITGQAALTTTEDGVRTLVVGNFTITDVDNAGPFTLTVLDGSNYTHVGNIITPALNYNGTLTIPVTVSDGAASSAVFNAALTITPVNDAPVITGQVTLSTAEDVALVLAAANFTVTDVDNAGPFTLTVNSGANYSVAGTTITPAANYNGSLTVPVTVSDGTATSNTFSTTVTVTPVNDPPSITGQVTLTTTEDTPLTLAAANFTITDVDNAGPFTLTVNSGANYSVAGTTITPAANYSGSLTVPVTVSDGTASSDVFNAAVTVTPVNDAPVITGQVTLSIQENQPLTIAVANLVITDPDDVPAGMTLTVLSGANYTVAGATITPAAGFNGTLTVPVYVNDGDANSNTYNLSVSVTEVNDPPVITGQVPLTVDEDMTLTLVVANFTITDIDDPTGPFTLTVQNGANYTHVGNVITPAANYNGPLTVPVIVSDGAATSNTFSATVTVTAVNDAPVITGQATLTTAEDVALTLVAGNFTITDVDNAGPFTLTVNSGANYSVAGTTITPAANYSGTLSVPVTVSDGTATSNTFSATVTVTPVNDPPSITGQVTLTTTEDTPLTLAAANFTITDVDNAGPFTLTVNSGANYSVAGTTITPAANYNGPLTVPVTVSDGAATSNTFSATVTVTAVNDSPVITGQVTLTTTEDTPLTLAAANFTITDVDNAGPFTLTVNSGANYSVAGTTITPVANYNGPLTVPVTVSDGTSSSAVFNAAVTVSPVNDAPVITGQVTLSIQENQPLTIAVANLVITDPDDAPAGMTLTVLSGANYTVSGATITPAAGFNGTLTVPVYVNDGDANSNTYNLSVSVTEVNDPPVITGQVPLTVAEDMTITLVVANFTITDIDDPAGPFTLTVQNGANYSHVGNIITPAANYNGPLTVPVTVSDGTSSSAPFNASVTVTPVNDPPSITGQVTLTTTEDTPLTLAAANFTISDVDNAGPFTLTVQDGVNYTHVGNVITPAANYNGSIIVPVTATDAGGAVSVVFNATVTVTAVNDAPIITGQSTLTTSEDVALTLVAGNFTVTDVDNAGPFTLTVQDGVNYTHVGNVITPALNFNGSLTVPVTVSDGAATSNTFSATVTVTAVNDAPVITGQATLTTAEDVALTLTSGNFTVTDVDNAGPFTLIVNTGANYSVAGTTITPVLNYNGSLTVPVTVSDGSATSNTFNATVTVTPVNDAPVITGQNVITVMEDNPITITVSHLVVTDPDNTPAQLSVIVGPGSHYTVVGTTITPELDFIGILTVPVTVTDGLASSNTINATVTVTPWDDSPLITGQSTISTDEDVQITLTDADFTISDVDDPTGPFALTVQDGANYTHIGNTITPALNFYGDLTVPVTVSDGSTSSNVFNATVTVNPVNDAPSITGQVILTTNEDQSRTLIPANFTIIDVDNAPGSFTLIVNNGANYSVSGTTITPALNFNGTLTVPVRVSDGSLSSSIFNALVTIAAVNDAPVVGDIPNQTFAEGTAFTPIDLNSFVEDVETVDQSVTWTFSGNGALTVAIVNNIATITAPNVNWNGSVTITFTAHDNDAVNPLTDSDAATFTVSPVNDVPVITSTPPTTAMTGSLYTYTITATDADAGDILTYSVPTLPSWLTFNATSHVLSGTPAAGDAGTHSVVLRVTDGQTPVEQSFTITVGTVNTAPDVTNIPSQSIVEGASFTTISLDNYVSDAQTADDAITWTYSGNTNLNVTIVNRVATITAPNSNWYGNETITFTARDNDPVNPLTDSDAATFTVSPVNDAPVVNDIPNQTIDEGGSFATIHLDDYVSDIETPDANITWTYSGNTHLVVSIVNHVATISAPNSDWNGTETVTFTARDNDPSNSLTASDAVIFTVKAVNDPPYVYPIPGQTIPEGGSFTPIHLDDYVEDEETPDEELSWSYEGNTDLQVSIVNRVAYITTPDPDWYGAEDITFTADDGANSLRLKCSATAKFTVTPVNDAPVVGDIPNQVIIEGSSFATINLNDYVYDIETPDNSISWVYSGSGALNVSIVNNVVTITLPGTNWNGSSTITFEARDNDAANPLTDHDAATFTVQAVNDVPVVSNIPDQAVKEGESFAVIHLDDFVTDIESADDLITWTYSGNSDLTVSIVNRVATIHIPGSHWTGSETITFTATDGDAENPHSDSDPAVFTVTNTNDSPVVNEIPNQTINEGEAFASIDLNNYVTDIETPDANITWTYSGNSDLTVTISNHIAYVAIPNEDWCGSEIIVFTARDDDDSMPLSASDAVAFTVNNVNDAPVILSQQVLFSPEDQVLTLSISSLNVVDVDNLSSDLSLNILPGNQYTVEGDNLLIPEKEFNGILSVNLAVYDPEGLSDTYAALVTITAVNDVPVLSHIPDQVIKQDSVFSNINLDDYVEDVETTDDLISWSYSGNDHLTVSIVNRVVTVTSQDDKWFGKDTIVFTATDNNPLIPMSVSDTVVFTVTQKVETDLFENTRIKAMIYPNPTQGWTMIQFEGQRDREVLIEILSVKGEMVYNAKDRIVDNRVNLSLDHLNSGSYFIRLITDDFVKVFTIIKN